MHVHLYRRYFNLSPSNHDQSQHGKNQGESKVSQFGLKNERGVEDFVDQHIKHGCGKKAGYMMHH
jgi:hypothetical protein